MTIVPENLPSQYRLVATGYACDRRAPYERHAPSAGLTDGVMQVAAFAGGSVNTEARYHGGLTRRSLFASMSNHIAKSVICSPAMSSTATRTIVAGVIALPGDAQDELDQAEHEARRTA